MIRVLHFVSTPAIWSGVMGVIMNYYRHLDRSEIQFDFLCFLPCEESYEEEIRTLGGRVFFLPKPGASLQGIRALKTMQKFFKEHTANYAWIHNHEVYMSTLLGHFVAQYGDGTTRLIVHCHATRYSDRRAAVLRNWLLCIPIAHMNCTRLACSAAAGRFLYRGFLKGGKTAWILPNTVEQERFLFNQKLRIEYQQALGLENTFVLGHVGRLVPQKNHLFLLRLFQLVYEKLPQARLLLIGGGEAQRESDMDKALEHLGLSNVVYRLGNRTDIPGLLQAMDVFLLPSLFEGLPLSCFEAQASGLPCLISDQVSSEVCSSAYVRQLPIRSAQIWAEECIRLQKEMKETPEAFDRTHPQGVKDIAIMTTKLATLYKGQRISLPSIDWKGRPSKC